MDINIITLGCSKNLVDSEHLLRQFKTNGFRVHHDAYDIVSDVVILNTCGFILDAKEESISVILNFLEEKRLGHVKKVLVMGCLSERYREDLQNEMPEVDGFFGVWDARDIVEAAGGRYYDELVSDRMTTTPEHYAFLKISEGCNRKCSFCAIPGIRGKQRSRSIESLVEEAENLAGRGAKEVILIAQDLTSYGLDCYGKKMLAPLIRELLEINDIAWIRLHYAYPTGFPEDVLDIMADDSRVCNYIDIPIQHISDRILTSMRRGYNFKELSSLLYRFREIVPGIAVRTTVMAGYPGETKEEFESLCNFIRTYKFDRLGVFPYSHEEDTPAGDQLVDDIPDEVKQERVERLMAIQQEISLEKNRLKVGRIFHVLIDDEEDDMYIGRTEYDSPEVDNEVIIKKPTGDLVPGEFYHVKVLSANEFDLFGEISSGKDA